MTVPKGRTAPTTGHTHQRLDAIAALSLAGFYLRRGNAAGAARKTRQALVAMRQMGVQA